MWVGQEGEGLLDTHIDKEKYFYVLFLILWARRQIKLIFELKKSKVNFKTKLLLKDYVEVATGWYLNMVLTMTLVIKIG